MKFDGFGFANFREFLSFAAENFKMQLFEDEKFREAVNQALSEAGKWHQRNCILKAPFMVLFVLLLILFRGVSIANIAKKILHQFRQWIPALPLNSITPEAFCHARKRLGVEPLKLLFEKLAKAIKPYATFHGLPVVGVDGTDANVPDTPDNEEYFGRPKVARDKAAHPALKIVAMLDTATRQVTGVEIDKCKACERSAFLKLFDKLPEAALVLVDRGISAQWLLERILEISRHFLVRISDSWEPDIVKTLGKGDYLVHIQGEIPSIRRNDDRTWTRKMKLRMIQYQIGDNKMVRLLTDLIDAEKYSAMELALLYHRRWECEISYDELKTHLSGTAGGAQDLIFRSKSPDGVLQEAYALFVLYNIIRGLMAEAGRLFDVNPLDISFVDTVEIIRETTLRFQQAKSEEERFFVTILMLCDIAATENHRPRRSRRYQRVVKKKMSNYGRKRRDCRQEPADIKRDLKLVG